MNQLVKIEYTKNIHNLSKIDLKGYPTLDILKKRIILKSKLCLDFSERSFDDLLLIDKVVRVFCLVSLTLVL